MSRQDLPLVKLVLNRKVNSDLFALRGMPLVQLSLSGSDVTDGGIRHLRGLPLTDLSLSGCRNLKDAALLALGGMHLPLTALDLSKSEHVSTNFTGAGLEGLRGMHLRMLQVFLGKPEVIFCLEPLRGMPLESLRLEVASNVSL